MCMRGEYVVYHVPIYINILKYIESLVQCWYITGFFGTVLVQRNYMYKVTVA